MWLRLTLDGGTEVREEIVNIQSDEHHSANNEALGRRSEGRFLYCAQVPAFFSEGNRLLESDARKLVSLMIEDGSVIHVQHRDQRVWEQYKNRVQKATEQGISLVNRKENAKAAIELLAIINEGKYLIAFPEHMQWWSDNHHKATACLDAGCSTNSSSWKNSVKVEVIVNTEVWPLLSTNTPSPPIRDTLGQDWSYERVCQWLGGEINYDHQKLLLCQTNPATGQPTNQLMRNEKLRRLLQLKTANHGPRQPRCHKLYYVKLPFRLSDWDLRKQCKLQALSYAHHFRHVVEITVFPDKLGTAQTLLDEAKREFDFAMAAANAEEPHSPSKPNKWSTGVLRLVYYSATSQCTRVYSPPIKPETTIAEMYANIRNMATPIMVRIEEVPEDQLEVRQNEWLMPVAHYDKELNRMFGVPFLVKMSNGEPYRQIKKRIQEILDVGDEEFEKYKFFLVSNNRIGRELDEGTVNLQELNASHHTCEIPRLHGCCKLA